MNVFAILAVFVKDKNLKGNAQIYVVIYVVILDSFVFVVTGVANYLKIVIVISV